MSQYAIQSILSGVNAGDASIRIEYDNQGNAIYIGKAKAGSAESSAVWQLQKMTYDNKGMTERNFASASTKFEFAWTNRAALSYS